MTRQEKVFKALELLKQGQELLDEAGFMLVFDSYNDDGAYAVPKEVDFPDEWGGRKELPNAGDFLSNCPTAIEISGLYNDGKRLVDNIPYWWKGWDKFIKPKKAKEKAPGAKLRTGISRPESVNLAIVETEVE